MLDITQVSRLNGIPTSSLRYYEEQGLIASAGRRALTRIFEQDVLTRLSLISVGQAAGFSLIQIADMLGTAGAPRLDPAQLAQQADALDRRIRQLVAMRDGLRDAMTCTAPSHLECPTFQRILRVGAARHQQRQRQRKRAQARATPK